MLFCALICFVACVCHFFIIWRYIGFFQGSRDARTCWFFTDSLGQTRHLQYLFGFLVARVLLDCTQVPDRAGPISVPRWSPCVIFTRLLALQTANACEDYYDPSGHEHCVPGPQCKAGELKYHQDILLFGQQEERRGLGDWSDAFRYAQKFFTKAEFRKSLFLRRSWSACTDCFSNIVLIDSQQFCDCESITSVDSKTLFPIQCVKRTDGASLSGFALICQILIFPLVQPFAHNIF